MGLIREGLNIAVGAIIRGYSVLDFFLKHNKYYTSTILVVMREIPQKYV